MGIQRRTTRPQLFCLVLFLFTYRSVSMAIDLYKIIQTARRPNPRTAGGKPLKIAIIGSGYAGLACGYFSSKIADAVTIFGLEASPGQQKSSSASTISAGLLHPLTPRGKVIYRGEEAFAASLALLDLAQQQSKEKIFQRYPFGDDVTAMAAGAGMGTGGVQKGLAAMLRPCFRESDLLNWKKAAVSNSKWVGVLSDEERNHFYTAHGSKHCSTDSSVAATLTASAVSRPSDAESSTDPSDPPLVPPKLLGVAVIKNSIVVNSPAYLKGLWRHISSQNTQTTQHLEHGDVTSTVTYEKRSVSAEEVELLSRDFDVVILAAGAGAQALWGDEDVLPFSYVRGQNIELTRDAACTGNSLDSVLLAGEYIIPRTRTAEENWEGDDQLQGGVDAKILLIGGTHEHALTMAELSAPSDMGVASQLLMGKMRAMYPAIEEDGWRPSKCLAGIRVVPARNNLGRLPAAGRHPKLPNVWVIGGLGSRGLLYHALLAQLLVQTATEGYSS